MSGIDVRAAIEYEYMNPTESDRTTADQDGGARGDRTPLYKLDFTDTPAPPASRHVACAVHSSLLRVYLTTLGIALHPGRTDR